MRHNKRPKIFEVTVNLKEHEAVKMLLVIYQIGTYEHKQKDSEAQQTCTT